MKRVAWGVALTVLVIAASTLACQPGGGAAMISAAERTAEAGSFRVRITHHVVPADAAETPGRTWSAEGAIDYRTGHGLLTLDIPSEGPGELRLLGDRAYLRMADLTLGGRPWMEIDLDRAAVPPTLKGLELGGNDPRGLVDALAGARSGVEEMGEASIRGKAVTRYQGSVDLRTAAEREDDAGKRLELISRHSGLEVLGVEAWIDTEGRARRMVYYLPASASAPSDAPSSTLDIELFDFGVAVDVQPPPPSEVTVFGELAGD